MSENISSWIKELKQTNISAPLLNIGGVMTKQYKSSKFSKFENIIILQTFRKCEKSENQL